MTTSQNRQPTASVSKIYPLSQASAPPPTVFTDVKDVLFESTIRYDESFFVGLNRIVRSEPWLDRDRAMIDQLRSLGIEPPCHRGDRLPGLVACLDDPKLLFRRPAPPTRPPGQWVPAGILARASGGNVGGH